VMVVAGADGGEGEKVEGGEVSGRREGRNTKGALAEEGLEVHSTKNCPLGGEAWGPEQGVRGALSRCG
jgi:hypothetical protein